MSSAAKRMIFASPRFGPLVYVVDTSESVFHAEDESTELTSPLSKPTLPTSPHFKGTFSTKVEESLEEALWWKLNQDFALSGNESEEYNYFVSKPTVKKIPKPSSNNSSPPLGDEEWMKINEDFALDSRHTNYLENDELGAPKHRKSTASPELPYGDYGVWWE